MDTDEAARAAIAAMHGRAVEGCTLTVHVAYFKPRDDRPNRGFRKTDRSGGDGIRRPGAVRRACRAPIGGRLTARL
jgi:hypothetical protein